MLQQQNIRDPNSPSFYEGILPKNPPVYGDSNFEEFYRNLFFCPRPLTCHKFLPAKLGDNYSGSKMSIFTCKVFREGKDSSKYSQLIELSENNRYKLSHIYGAFHSIKCDYGDNPEKAILYLHLGDEFFPIKTINVSGKQKFSFHDHPILMHPCFDLSIEIIYGKSKYDFMENYRKKIKIETFYIFSSVQAALFKDC